MDENKQVDTANEPVEYDEGIVDTGVLHETKTKVCADPDCAKEHPHQEEKDD